MFGVFDSSGNWFWDDHLEVFGSEIEAKTRAVEACDNAGLDYSAYKIIPVSIQKENL